MRVGATCPSEWGLRSPDPAPGGFPSLDSGDPEHSRSIRLEKVYFEKEFSSSAVRGTLMSPGRDESFPTLFERLDDEARREFVAGLYASRGWETRVEDGSIVATRDGQTRRIAVVQPRRFGTPSIPDVDTVVVSEPSEAVRTIAEGRGMDYVTPTDLRNRLLYGLDRAEAADLFQEHFDRPLSVIESTTETDGSATPLGPRPSVPSLMAQQTTVAVAVLLVAAVLFVGPGLVPDAESPSELPEPNSTYTPGSIGALGGEKTYPSGLGPDGVEDSRELTNAHFQHLSNQSHAYRIAMSGPQHAPFMLGLSSWNATVYFENDTRYSYRRSSVAPHGFHIEHRTFQDGENVTVWTPIRNLSADNQTNPEVLTKRVYANETAKFWRVDTPEGVHYRRLTAAEANTTRKRAEFYFTDRVSSVHTLLRQLLDTDDSSIQCTESTETGDCRTYRVVATDDPGVRGDAAEYRAVAVVESSGFVRSLTARYTLPKTR